MYIEEQLKELQKQMEDLQLKIKYFQAKGGEEILTPEEFAQKTKLNQNTVYCWIREGRIKVLPNLGKALWIPMSQFYEPEEEIAHPVFSDILAGVSLQPFRAATLRVFYFYMDLITFFSYWRYIICL